MVRGSDSAHRAPDRASEWVTQSLLKLALSSHIKTIVGIFAQFVFLPLNFQLHPGWWLAADLLSMFDSELALRVDPFTACARRASPIVATGIFVPPSNKHCTKTKASLCRVLFFLPTPSVKLAVTTNAERNQVVHHIVTEAAPWFHVMDLQAFHGTALLTPPAISFHAKR